MAIKVVEVQQTPNPNAMKFVLDGEVSQAPESYFDADSARGRPLPERLFSVAGVASLLLLGDFITVNRKPGASWKAVQAGVERALAEWD